MFECFYSVQIEVPFVQGKDRTESIDYIGVSGWQKLQMSTSGQLSGSWEIEVASPYGTYDIVTSSSQVPLDRISEVLVAEGYPEAVADQVKDLVREEIVGEFNQISLDMAG